MIFSMRLESGTISSKHDLKKKKKTIKTRLKEKNNALHFT